MTDDRAGSRPAAVQQNGDTSTTHSQASITKAHKVYACRHLIINYTHTHTHTHTHAKFHFVVDAHFSLDSIGSQCSHNQISQSLYRTSKSLKIPYTSYEPDMSSYYTVEQRTLWDRGLRPVFRGCPLFGGCLIFALYPPACDLNVFNLFFVT